MLDIRLIREQTDSVRQRLATRGAGDEGKIDEVLHLDEQRRKFLAEVEQLKAARNRVSKEIGALMAQKKAAEAEAKKTETRQMGDRITELDKQTAAVEQQRDALLLQLPNLPHPSVKIGRTAEDNLEMRTWGKKGEFGFKPKTHVELCESLKLVDFARAAKISGSGFLLYTNWGARLERALIQFLLELHTGEHGYTEVSPPFLVNAACMTGVGQFPKFADQYYAVQEGQDAATLGKLFLIPTAETPVANIHRDEIFEGESVAHSLLRLHAVFSRRGGRGRRRYARHDPRPPIRQGGIDQNHPAGKRLRGIGKTGRQRGERVLQLLGLHYRVVQLCTGDMGFASALTYDIEVWAPGQSQYLEVSSCSNCEDFQARRMNMRYKNDAGEHQQHPQYPAYPQRQRHRRWRGFLWRCWKRISSPTAAWSSPRLCNRG